MLQGTIQNPPMLCVLIACEVKIKCLDILNTGLSEVFGSLQIRPQTPSCAQVDARDKNGVFGVVAIAPKGKGLGAADLKI